MTLQDYSAPIGPDGRVYVMTELGWQLDAMLDMDAVRAEFLGWADEQ